MVWWCIGPDRIAGRSTSHCRSASKLGRFRRRLAMGIEVQGQLQLVEKVAFQTLSAIGDQRRYLAKRVAVLTADGSVTESAASVHNPALVQQRHGNNGLVRSSRITSSF